MDINKPATVTNIAQAEGAAQITKWRLNPRTMLAFFHDIFASTLAWVLAFWLRFNLDIPPLFSEQIWKTIYIVVPIQTLLFWRFGLYKGIWRYASLPDLRRILLSVLAGTVVFTIAYLSFKTPLELGIPRSVLILDPILLVLIMGGSRLAYRAWKEHWLYSHALFKGKPVFVLGAGDTTVSLLKELSRSNEWRVVGLLDDDAKKRGRVLQDVKILGLISDLPKFANKMGVKFAIMAMPSANPVMHRRIIELCSEAGVKALRVPTMVDLISGKVSVSQIRNVELDDLLGRDPVVLDTSGLNNWLSQRIILVSGAGGSIGSELCRQIASFKPHRIILFELNEYSLYSIHQEFNERFPEIETVCAIGDVKDQARVEQILAQYSPSVIFHAAAYKHVPLMENENVWETIKNNALGTYVLAQAAIKFRTEKFVLVSTDKAVNPINVMGASKQLAEMICLALQQSSITRFITVRFGNVLGSTGSVIPKFRKQILDGGPITVTHPDIARYFMSIPEAAQLVLQAGLMGKGGEIFVLDMGQPVKIVDLATDLIRLSGLSQDEIKIVYTGLRPGEKLHEELLADDENTIFTPHPKLRIAKARNACNNTWLNEIYKWLTTNPDKPEQQIKSELNKWIAENGRTSNLADKSVGRTQPITHSA